MEILKVIKSRRSVMPHQFNDYPIEEEELNNIAGRILQNQEDCVHDG